MIKASLEARYYFVGWILNLTAVYLLVYQTIEGRKNSAG